MLPTNLDEIHRMSGVTAAPIAEPDPMLNETVEQQIQRKGLTAPRVTPQRIDEVIASESFHVFPGSCLTVCCLTLANGFPVTGESACASPENFNAEIGQRVARENAKQKIWALEGYLLKQQLHNDAVLGLLRNEQLSRDLTEHARSESLGG